MAKDTEILEYEYSPAPNSSNNQMDGDGVRYNINENLFVYSKKLNKDIQFGETEDIPKGNKIRISGKYPQNYIDVNTYNLSKIRPISGTNFQFVVKLKEETSLPSYYTSRIFYEQLEKSLKNSNPHFSNQYIDKAAIVEIDVTTLLNKIKTLREIELTNEVIVTKNLFLKFPSISFDFIEISLKISSTKSGSFDSFRLILSNFFNRVLSNTGDSINLNSLKRIT
jgi:hypothetical protein